MNASPPNRLSIVRPLAALALTIAAVVLVGARATPAMTVPSGLLLVLVLPGYVWVNAFFAGDPQPLVRPALIVASSLGITMVVGLLADVLPGGITRTDWCIGFEAAVVLGVVVTLIRAALSPRDERAATARTGWQESIGSRRLVGVLSRLGFARCVLLTAEVVSVVVLLVAAGWVSVRSEADWEARQHFTALSIAGVGNQRPTIEVSDHEGVTVPYTINVTLRGRQVLTESLRIQNGQTRHLPLFGVIPPLRPGRLVVTLYRPGAKSPYRQVWLRAVDGLWG